MPIDRPPVHPAVHKLRIRLLNMRAVLQHLLAKVDRRRCRVDRPAISLLHQQRKIAAVVDVRMRQHDSVYLIRRQRQMLIDVPRLLPVPLKHSAVEQNILSRTLQMMRRARNRLCRTPEVQSNRHSQSLHEIQTILTDAAKCRLRTQQKGPSSLDGPFALQNQKPHAG